MPQQREPPAKHVCPVEQRDRDIEDLLEQIRIQQIAVQIDEQRSDNSCRTPRCQIEEHIREAIKSEYRSISRNTINVHA